MLTVLRRFSSFIRLSHTAFALPFCMIAALVAMRDSGFDGKRLSWILAAFISARAFAMAMNRVIDRRIDALNPRTQDRHLPSGTITLRQAAVFTAACAMVFFISAAMLGRICWMLSPAVLVYLLFYSYTKRFTSVSHLVLGGALALAPLGAELAIRGGFSAPVMVLAGAVLFWVAAFDIFYACLDIDFDRSHGLYSIPSRLGKQVAMKVAMLLHTLAAGLFIGFGFLSGMESIFFVAQAAVIGLLVYEHRLMRQDKVEPAFFQMNGGISLIQLLAVSADLWFRR